MRKFDFTIFLVVSIICTFIDIGSVDDVHLIVAQVGAGAVAGGALATKYILPAVITAGAGLFSNIFGSIFGSSSSRKQAEFAYRSQQETNQTNLEIARQTNETNRQNVLDTNEANLNLAREQNQWNLDQWNRENEYNSPAHQVELYKAAGLNPALVGGNFTPAQQLMSADLANQQAPQAFAPQINDPAKAALPYNQDAIKYLQGIGSALEKFANGIGDASMKESQIKRNEILNNVSSSDIRLAAKQESIMAESIKKVQNENEFFSRTFEERLIQVQQASDLNDALYNIYNQDIAIKHGQQRLISAQATHEEVKSALAYIGLMYCALEKEANLARVASETYVNNSRGNQLGIENDFMAAHGGYKSSDLVGMYVADKGLEGTKYSSDKHAETIKSEGRANRWTNIMLQNQRLGYEDKWRTHSEVREYTKMFINGLAIGAGTYFGVASGAPNKFVGGILKTVRAFKANKLPLQKPSLFSGSLKPHQFGH